MVIGEETSVLLRKRKKQNGQDRPTDKPSKCVIKN